MRFVRRVRWLRVSLVGLLALVALLSFRLWQWMAYAERQATGVEREEAHAEASEQEIDRLNRELKDTRTLIHGHMSDFEYYDVATLPPAKEQIVIHGLGGGSFSFDTEEEPPR
jgi:hypothetical protein